MRIYAYDILDTSVVFFRPRLYVIGRILNLWKSCIDLVAGYLEAFEVSRGPMQSVEREVQIGRSASPLERRVTAFELLLFGVSRATCSAA